MFLSNLKVQSCLWAACIKVQFSGNLNCKSEPRSHWRNKKQWKIENQEIELNTN